VPLLKPALNYNLRRYTVASGLGAVSEGVGSMALGSLAHAEGDGTFAAGGGRYRERSFRGFIEAPGFGLSSGSGTDRARLGPPFLYAGAAFGLSVDSEFSHRYHR
jgi:hypothetical protein